MLISLLKNQCPSNTQPPLPSALSLSIHVSLSVLLDLNQDQAVSQSAVHTHTHSQVRVVFSLLPVDITVVIWLDGVCHME